MMEFRGCFGAAGVYYTLTETTQILSFETLQFFKHNIKIFGIKEINTY